MPQLSDVTTRAHQAMSIAYNNRVYEMLDGGEEVLILSLGEAYFDIPLYPMDDLPYPEVNHYSHSRGLPGLRRKLAGYFLSEYGVGFNPETEIIITAGSKAAIHMTLMSILNPGDEVLIWEPAWVSYPEQVKLCYGVPVSIPYTETPSSFATYVTPKTRAIIVNNPNNPRGLVLSEEDLKQIYSLARAHDLWILSDEAYSDFLVDRSFISFASVDPKMEHTVIFNSMSKNYGISGWRIGYVIANPELTFNILKVNQHLLTCPATILEYYLERHFDDLIAITKPQIKALVRKRQELDASIQEIGLQRLDGSATFYFFVSIEPSKLDSQQFATQLLETKHISVVPGSGYGRSCDAFIRVSIGTADVDEIKTALRKIKHLIEETS